MVSDTEEEDEFVPGEDALRGAELRKTIDFGLSVKQFLDGDIGRRLQNDSERERLDRMEELVQCDEDTAEGRAEARAIRHRIGILDHWQYLFASYIEAGEKAEVQFQEE